MAGSLEILFTSTSFRFGLIPVVVKHITPDALSSVFIEFMESSLCVVGPYRMRRGLDNSAGSPRILLVIL
ncbi:hypothetical protein Tco_1005828 [Tanacetum coccineum]|uniref:Uncharacterized protein n=1 Tax=Tanacetum coccineum TaxID=301880 RepID=A0ABQ5FH73_9ASTR